MVTRFRHMIAGHPMTNPLLPRMVATMLCLLGSTATVFGADTPGNATDSQSQAPVQLAIFEVGADQDKGYAASTAMTGTRTNEKLENLPNSISIMTQEF